MKNKQMISIIMALSAMVLAAGCGSSGDARQAAVPAEVSIRETVEVADPQQAMDEIYQLFSERTVTRLDGDLLEGEFGIRETQVVSHWVYVSDNVGKLANVAIIQPLSSERDTVREALYVYKETQAEEYKDYDIIDSYAIAEGAEVFDQGDFVILLMLPDNDAGREIIDKYIPS